MGYDGAVWGLVVLGMVVWGVVVSVWWCSGVGYGVVMVWYVRVWWCGVWLFCCDFE